MNEKEAAKTLDKIRAYIENCPRKSITDKQARQEALEALAALVDAITAGIDQRDVINRAALAEKEGA